MNKLKSDVINCLSDLKGSGKFATIHNSDFILPGLTISDIGEVSFPLNEEQAKKIIKVAHKAPFGKGSETILDTNVRSAWEIDANNISFRNPNWDSFIQKVIKKVKEDLGLTDYVISSQVYKLLIYEEGDFFLPHKDSEKEKGMFGSLVLSFPSNYTGGELVMNFEGEQLIADFSSPNDYKIHYAAFYADCDHEVKKLTSGYRICLVYNLIQQEVGTKIELQSLNNYVDKLTTIFTTHPTEKPLIVLLGHQYTPENFSYDSLKLNDRYKADVLLKTAQKMGYYAKMCLVTSFIEGSPEYDNYNGYLDYNDEDEYDEEATMGEIHDEELYIDNWVNDEIPSLNIFSFEEEDLITSFKLDDDEPILKESTGYMGNYGPDLMHWYHYGAVTMWSKEQNTTLLLSQPIHNQLKWIEYFNKTKQASDNELLTINSIIYTLDVNHEEITKNKPDFNPIADWIINQNKESLLINISTDKLQFLFEKIDISHWVKLMEWLSKANHDLFLNKITKKITSPVLEKLLQLIRAMKPSAKPNDEIVCEIIKLPFYIQSLSENSSLKLKSNAISDLLWIERQMDFSETKSSKINAQSSKELKENWITTIHAALTKKPDWQYIHKVFILQLLTEEPSALRNKLLKFCQEYLQERVNNKPQPPQNWTRSMPNVKADVKIWAILEDFIKSPDKMVFEYKRVQEERTRMESAINYATVDLRTETIRKGSPHTLRIIKTQASFERLLVNWEKDEQLLRRVKEGI
jgi:predicted 2-oxoglutarate/Fe(II)-dependent dioxygenase YbiX